MHLEPRRREPVTQPTNVRWRVLGLVMATAAIGYVLRINLSIAGPSIKSELGLSEWQLGLVLSAFVTTYAVGQIPGGLVGERFGPRRLACCWSCAVLWAPFKRRSFP